MARPGRPRRQGEPGLADQGSRSSLIATFPPGGTADTISRILAPKLCAGLGTQVVVENKPGAGGTIGSDLAAKAPPDGYTLVISHASPLGIAPGIYPKLPYNVVTDFTHVTLIGHTPNVLIVPAESPYKTLADYIADAKAKPDQIAFGSSGIGSNTHLMGELLSSDGRHQAEARALQGLGAVAAGHAGRRHPLDVRSRSPPTCRTSTPARCACWR